MRSHKFDEDRSMVDDAMTSLWRYHAASKDYVGN